MKRFWTEAAAVAAEGGWRVTLDGKPLRTPEGSALLLPTRALADAIAAEWNATEPGSEVHSARFRMTPIAQAAQVAFSRGDAAGLAQRLAAYGASDLVCYRAEAPEALRAAQADAWDPIVRWAENRYDIRLYVTSGVVHATQPQATIERLSAVVAAQSPWVLAALAPVVTISGSLLIGLALLEGAIDSATAWTAGTLDELWQAERWGEDELAAAARADKRASLEAGALFLALLRT